MTRTLEQADWTFVSGVTAVAETRLLTNDEFLDLLHLPTLDAFVQRLKQVETYAHMPVPESPDAARRTVEQEYIRGVRIFRSESPDAAVSDLALVNYLFAELRSFVRSRLLKEQAGRAALSFFTVTELESLWNDSADAREDLRAPVERIRRGLEPLDFTRGGERVEPLTEDPTGFIDLLLDREELVYFLEQARAVGSPFITGWAEKCVRLTAALAVIRARLSGEKSERLTGSFLAPPLDDEWLLALAVADADRTGTAFARHFASAEGESVEVSRASVGKIARMVDDRLTLDAIPAKHVTFGPERVFGYLRGLHIENLNLRLITETFVVQGDRDETRRRLRLSYA